MIKIIVFLDRYWILAKTKAEEFSKQQVMARV
jgi:hypothetical protein